MRLREVEFGPIFCGSGAMGFFGEGYSYHKMYKMLSFGRFGFKGVTFVAKTTTIDENPGNMPLSKKDKISPVERRPKCIWIDPVRCDVLNAVGLSGPGAMYLLSTERWQKRKHPFLISFMAIGKTTEERIDEVRRFVSLIKKDLRKFEADFGIEFNISCPNVGLNPGKILAEAKDVLDVFAELGVPIVIKINALVPPHVAVTISEHLACDAITVSNTIPYHAIIPWLPEKDIRQINWDEIFGKDKESPLQKRGLKQPGGLSGPRLFSIVVEWVYQARQAGLKKPIIAGGGVFSPQSVFGLKNVGASAVYISTVALLRPWRVRAIVRKAHELWKGE